MWNVLNSTRERLNYAQKPIFDATTFHFSQNLQPQKLHSAWYKGDIVTLRCRGYIATISADWDVEYIDLNDYFACDADLKKNCVATCDFRKHLVSKISLNCTFSTPKGLAKTIALKSKWLNNAIIEVFQDIFPDEDKMKEDIYIDYRQYTIAQLFSDNFNLHIFANSSRNNPLEDLLNYNFLYDYVKMEDARVLLDLSLISDQKERFASAIIKNNELVHDSIRYCTENELNWRSRQIHRDYYRNNMRLVGKSDLAKHQKEDLYRSLAKTY